MKQELPGIILKDGKRYMEVKGELRAVCGAKTRSGKPCKNSPMANGRCRMHGGKSLGGVASPRYKHGRYSKYAPKRILEKYEQSLNDTELLRLDDEIALIDVRISELLETIDLGDSRNAWYGLRRAYDSFRDANARQDGAAAARAITTIGAYINNGIENLTKWNELFNAFENRRKLVEAERRRRMDMQMMISAEEMNVVLTIVLDVIKDHVPRERLPDVTEEFKKILLR